MQSSGEGGLQGSVGLSLRPQGSRRRGARVRRSGLAAAALGLGLAGAVVSLPGCPANSCFLTVCSGDDCRCSISSCPTGSAYDLKQKRCRCVKGYLSVQGQCLTQAQANTFCGAAYSYVPGRGCLKNSCRPGDFLDESTGWCIPKDQVASGIGAGETLACKPGEQLVVDGGQPSCIPAAQSCAKDEVWSEQACRKTQECPTGAVYDVALGQCVTYLKGGGSDDAVVDVQQWVYSNYGPPGAVGAPGFCATFAKKPAAFGITAGNTAFIRVTVNTSFADREIARGQLATLVVYDHSGSAVPARGAQEVDTGAKTFFVGLVAGGGRASQATATTTVRCAVTNASAPAPAPMQVPPSGGL